MHTSLRLAALLGTLSLAACSSEVPERNSSGGSSDTGSVADTSPTDTTSDAAADTGAVEDTTLPDSGAVDSGVGDTGTAEDTTPSDTGTADAGSDPLFSLAPGQCFTLETGAVQTSDGTMCGDFLALSGLNVDLTSDGGPDGAGAFCDVGGPYASIDAVPTNSADCFWQSYVEGFDPLDGHGLLVRNAAQTQTWVLYIVTNAQPAMQFYYRPLASTGG